jgi:hypothetical protein
MAFDKKTYAREYRLKNKEKHNEQVKNSYKKHRNNVLSYKKKYYETHLEKICEKGKNYRKDNPEKFKMLNKEYRLNNKELISIKGKEKRLKITDFYVIDLIRKEHGLTNEEIILKPNLIFIKKVNLKTKRYLKTLKLKNYATSKQ